MKLFTIGDSISQGFMSLAAARTDLSYSTLIAAKLGLPKNDYRFADWGIGLPINVEAIMRALNQRYGSNINLVEWLTVLQTINNVVDESEDYFERGLGSPDKPYGGGIEFFNNVAVWGFDVADAWQVTPELCRREIEFSNSDVFNDGYLTGASEPMYRTALKILNPSLAEKYNGFSQLSWLEKHSGEGDGVENLVLWLGANNALGTVLRLDIRQTPNNPNERPHQVSHVERTRVRKWNLWQPDDFRADYTEMLDRVDAIMKNNQAKNWKVFIGTIPLVTIAPITKGVGTRVLVPDKGYYYKYYTYFPFEEEYARETGTHLPMDDAIHIDDCIRQYNRDIRKLVADKNKQHGSERYFIVDICQTLEDLAFKRNDSVPKYQFPEYFEFAYPKVNTKYYHADTFGRLKQGGLFTLDGVHPTAIGHGIIAYEFLKKMNKASVADINGNIISKKFTNDEWREIFNNDTLYSKPITIMQELYGKDNLAQHIVKFIKLFKS